MTVQERLKHRKKLIRENRRMANALADIADILEDSESCHGPSDPDSPDDRIAKILRRCWSGSWRKALNHEQ